MSQESRMFFEKGAIGSALSFSPNQTKFFLNLTENDFTNIQTKTIFSVIDRLRKNGEVLEIGLPLAHELAKTGVWKKDIDAFKYLAELTDVKYTTLSIESHIKNLKEDSAIKNCKNAIERALKLLNSHDIEGAYSVLREDIKPIESSESVYSYADIASKVLAEEELFAIGQYKDETIKTNFTELDNLINGLQAGALAVIAGRPSMGKTTLAVNICANIARAGKKVLIFSLEMGKESIIRNLLSSESSIDSRKFNFHKTDRNDRLALAEAVERTKNFQISINDISGLHYHEIASIARTEHVRSRNGLGAIMIDYLQLIQGDADKTREREVARISGAMKSLAKELKVPVILLSQLSRKCEERVDKRPMLSDLRDSGAVEQDSDIILFCYREDYYLPDTPNKGVAEVIVAKNRLGATGKAELVFKREFSRFENKPNLDLRQVHVQETRDDTMFTKRKKK